MSSLAANRQRFWVASRYGLHLRAAARIAETASRFESTITLRHNRREVDAKSAVSVVTLCAPFGAEVIVSAEGPDGRQAMRAIADVFAEELADAVPAAHGEARRGSTVVGARMRMAT
jgi:phosphocarrier protein